LQGIGKVGRQRHDTAVGVVGVEDGEPLLREHGDAAAKQEHHRGVP